ADALVNILAKDTPAEPPARPAIAVLPSSGSNEGPSIVRAGPGARPISDDAVGQSNAVLSPPQVAALRQIQGEMNAAAAAARLFNGLLPQPGLSDDEILPAAFKVLMQ